jgi:hypothetical protein
MDEVYSHVNCLKRLCLYSVCSTYVCELFFSFFVLPLHFPDTLRFENRLATCVCVCVSIIIRYDVKSFVEVQCGDVIGGDENVKSFYHHLTGKHIRYHGTDSRPGKDI